MTSGGVTFKWPNFDDIERIPREDGGVDIMLDGRLLTTIEPITRKSTPAENEAHLCRMRELSKIISEQWKDKSISAVDAVREQRRNLTPDEWGITDEQFNS